MPAISISSFTDPGAFQEAVGSAQVEVLITARGGFHAELTRIDLDRVSLQAGRETLPRVGRGAVGAERSVVYFLVGADQAPGRHCGAELAPGEIVVNAAGSTYHHLTSAGCRWGDVSIPVDVLAAAPLAISGRHLTLSDVPQIVRPPRGCDVPTGLPASARCKSCRNHAWPAGATGSGSIAGARFGSRRDRVHDRW
jgi:hypothetical protein